MNEIQKESKKSQFTDNAKGVVSNQYTPQEDERQYTADIGRESGEPGDQQSPFTKRIKKGAPVLFAVGIIAMVIYGMVNTGEAVDTSGEAAAALETHMSTTLAPGTRLLSADDNYAGFDAVVSHDSDDSETTMYVWDYAAEDGDYVQIIVDGTPLGDPFMIKNKPAVFTVPAVGEVQVLGTRDGGGGITYAVYYDVNHTVYFNGVSEGGDNLYTLVRE